MNTDIIIIFYLFAAFFFFLGKEYFQLFMFYRTENNCTPALLRQVKGEYTICIWAARVFLIIAFVCSVIEYIQFNDIII